MSKLLNIYSSKINNYKYVYLEKEFNYLKFMGESKKKELVSRSSYFFYDLMDNDLIFNKFIAYFTKKSEKAKHYNMLYRAFKYIKFSMKQQPSLFFKKSLKVNNLFFEV